MTELLLLWLIPGYIYLEFLRHIVPKRNLSGWDFIARVGIYAGVLFVVSSLLYAPLRYLVSDTAAGWLRANLYMSGPTKALPIGVLLAFGVGALAVKYAPLRKWYWSISHVDPYLEIARQAKTRSGGYILVSLKNGKVYVGQPVNATFDPNEATRTLALQVELSGYREKDTHVVRFNKNYGGIVESPDDRTILLAVSEIFALSPFNAETHKRFVEAGITKLGRSDESNG